MKSNGSFSPPLMLFEIFLLYEDFMSNRDGFYGIVSPQCSLYLVADVQQTCNKLMSLVS